MTTQKELNKLRKEKKSISDKLSRMEFLVLLLLFSFIFSSSLASAWYNGEFLEYRKPIYLYSVSSTNLTNFVINYTIDTASLISAGKMQFDCDDLRFVDSTDTIPLNYHFERITSPAFGCNTNNTIVWIQIPLLKAENNTFIYMYYGNDELSANATSTGTYDATFNFTSHHSELQGNLTDVAKANDLKYTGNPTRVEGIFGNSTYSSGISYNGFESPSPGSHNFIDGDFTLTSWFNCTGGTGTSRMIVKKATSNSNHRNYAFEYKDNDEFWCTIHVNITGSPIQYYVKATAMPSLNEWHYAACRWDSLNHNLSLWIDGTYNNSVTTEGNSIYATNTSEWFMMHYEKSGCCSRNNFFPGSIDEVRVFNESKPTGWITMEYAIAKINLTATGSEEHIPAFPSITLNSPEDMYTSESNPVTFSCNASDSYGLKNLSLWLDYTGSWIEWKTKAVTGTSDTESFQAFMGAGIYHWSCSGCNILGNCNLNFSENRTIISTGRGWGGEDGSGALGYIVLVLFGITVLCFTISFVTKKMPLIIVGILLGIIFLIFTFQTMILLPEVQMYESLLAQLIGGYRIIGYILWVVIVFIVIMMIFAAFQQYQANKKKKLREWGLLMEDE